MLLPILLACAHAPQTSAPAPEQDSIVPATVTGEAMGGALRVVVRCPRAEHAACLAAGVAAREEVLRLEALATDWKPEGQISALNAHAGQGAVPVSGEVAELLRTSLALAEASGGAFDPTVGALWRLWDFEAGRVPTEAERAEAVARVGWQRLTLGPEGAALADPGMAVTLGGVAQGYAAQAALGQIPARWEALVDVSGDVAVRGAWTIELQHPRRPRGEAFAAVTLRDAVLVTSGDYERAFVRDGVRYHHVLDPRTGLPSTGAMSATAVHPRGDVADGLATALMITGPDTGLAEGLGAWALLFTEAGVVERGDRAAGAHQVTVWVTDAPATGP